jgi:hypothetical protein
VDLQSKGTGSEVQSSTHELINGLVSLVHQQQGMTELMHQGMEALLVLHQPDKIEMWNPEAPIQTFWDIRSVFFFFSFHPRIDQVLSLKVHLSSDGKVGALPVGFRVHLVRFSG